MRVETRYPQYSNERWLKYYPRKNQDEVFIKALYSENNIGEEPLIKPLRKIGYRDFSFYIYWYLERITEFYKPFLQTWEKCRRFSDIFRESNKRPVE